MKTKGDQTKQRILETASDLFWKHSYHGLNMNAISQAAGVNKATVYGYFSSKEELAIATIRSNHQQAKTCLLEPCLQKTDDPLEQLGGLYHALYTVAKRTFKQEGVFPGCPFINIAMELSTANPTIREAVQDVFEEQAKFYGKIVQNAIAQGVCSPNLDLAQTAKGLVATMNGALVLAKVHNSPEEILSMLPVAQKLLTQ